MSIDIHSHLHHFNPDELKNISLHPDCPHSIISSVHSVNEYEYTLTSLKKHNNIKISAGIHPQSANLNSEVCINFLESLRDILKKCILCGEIGYDIHPVNQPFEVQNYFLKKQLEIAAKASMPVILHCRGAYDEIIDELEKTKFDCPVIFHGYSGGFKHLDRIIKKGYYISFGLSVTYPDSRKLRRIAALIPSGRILTETDSPFCLFRGADGTKDRSYPFMIGSVESAIAEAKGTDRRTITETVFENVQTILKK